RRPPRCWNGRAGGRLCGRTHGHDHRSGRGPPGSFGKAWRAACPAELAVARRLGGGHDHACRQHVDDQCRGRHDMSAAVVELYVGARVWFEGEMYLVQELGAQRTTLATDGRIRTIATAEAVRHASLVHDGGEAGDQFSGGDPVNVLL